MIYGHARASICGQTLDARLELLHAAPCGCMERENVSGAKSDRRARRRMLGSLAAFDLVTVRRIGRLARSTFDAGTIIGRIVDGGAQFRSWADTSTSTGGLMMAVLGGLADGARGLIRARTTEGRRQAIARGVKLGRKPKLTSHQMKEAIKHRDDGEPVREIARSYNVHHSTISRVA